MKIHRVKTRHRVLWCVMRFRLGAWETISTAMYAPRVVLFVSTSLFSLCLSRRLVSSHTPIRPERGFTRFGGRPPVPPPRETWAVSLGVACVVCVVLVYARPLCPVTVYTNTSHHINIRIPIHEGASSYRFRSKYFERKSASMPTKPQKPSTLASIGLGGGAAVLTCNFTQCVHDAEG